MAIGKHDVHSETYQNLYHNMITFKRPPPPTFLYLYYTNLNKNNRGRNPS